MEDTKTSQVDNQSNLLVLLIEPLIREAIDKALANILSTPSTGPEVPIGIHEAAALIGKAVPTLYALHHQGKIPASVCSKFGRRLYFYPAALLQWVKAGNKKTLHNEPA